MYSHGHGRRLIPHSTDKFSEISVWYLLINQAKAVSNGLNSTKQVM
jgi:hypothetical protein